MFWHAAPFQLFSPTLPMMINKPVQSAGFYGETRRGVCAILAVIATLGRKCDEKSSVGGAASFHANRRPWIWFSKQQNEEETKSVEVSRYSPLCASTKWRLRGRRLEFFNPIYPHYSILINHLITTRSFELDGNSFVRSSYIWWATETVPFGGYCNRIRGQRWELICQQQLENTTTRRKTKTKSPPQKKNITRIPKLIWKLTCWQWLTEHKTRYALKEPSPSARHETMRHRPKESLHWSTWPTAG